MQPAADAAASALGNEQQMIAQSGNLPYTCRHDFPGTGIAQFFGKLRYRRRIPHSRRSDGHFVLQPDNPKLANRGGKSSSGERRIPAEEFTCSSRDKALCQSIEEL
jgi:hypothetical protein